MASKRELIQKLLKGIETGDPKAASVVNESRYIQHNPQTHEGSEGLAALFARLAQTNPKVTFMRVFEDGDFAFAHNQYDFAHLNAAFEVFRFENGQAVEHWDNIQPLRGPNPSGRGMLEGESTITDLALTEENRARAGAFVQEVLIGGALERFEQFVTSTLIQHNPELPDGAAPWRMAMMQQRNGQFRLHYQTLHRVLAEGNFALCISEGYRDGVHSSFYDLLRFEEGRIVEHWDTIEKIAPRHEWKNQNGKF